MPAIRLARLATIVVPLLLAGCGSAPVRDDGGAGSRGNELSDARVAELREALIGREVVFKLDWHEHHCLQHFRRFPCASKMGVGGGLLRKLDEEDFKVGNRLVAAGSVGRISGMNTSDEYALVVFVADPANRPVKLFIQAPWSNPDNRLERFQEDFSDSLVTVDWVERQLSGAVDFLGPVAAPAAVPAQALGAPAVAGLDAPARPQIVSKGETVELMLSYRIEGDAGAGVAVLERRDLQYGGRRLPNYPVERQLSRAAGSFETSYRQRVPAAAKPGFYKYVGEVCIGGDCVRSEGEFVVR